MIQTEIVTYGGTEFVRTYSDAEMMIERDGVLYEEAVDPIGSGREYNETEQPIIHEDMEAEEADYLAALERLGVSADA